MPRPRNPRPSELADRIEAAADLIGTKGWCRGDYRKGERHCMVGAVQDVIRKSDTLRHVRAALSTSLSMDYNIDPDAHEAPETWNDDQSDARKVRRAMYRTARRLRAGGIRFSGTNNKWGEPQYLNIGGK